MKQFSIKDLEHLTGVKAHTIRIWEQRYQVLEPQRTDTNIRYYAGSELKHLINVATLVESGKRISKVAAMTREAVAQEAGNLNLADASAAGIAGQMKQSMLEYDERLFVDLSDRFAAEHGFERLFTEVYLPFLDQVGLLWLSDAICPAQEHFLSQLIRQQLYARLAAMPMVANPKRVLVHYLPEQETHELSLLFMHYLAKARGDHSLFLGSSVPFGDLAQFASHFPSVDFVTYCTVHPDGDRVRAYVDQIKANYGDSPHRFWLAGRPFADVVPEPSFLNVFQNGHTIIGALHPDQPIGIS
jgi:DNA-binding transcriptional MerR regulator